MQQKQWRENVLQVYTVLRDSIFRQQSAKLLNLRPTSFKMFNKITYKPYPFQVFLYLLWILFNFGVRVMNCSSDSHTELNILQVLKSVFTGKSFWIYCTVYMTRYIGLQYNFAIIQPGLSKSFRHAGIRDV